MEEGLTHFQSAASTFAGDSVKNMVIMLRTGSVNLAQLRVLSSTFRAFLEEHESMLKHLPKLKDDLGRIKDEIDRAGDILESDSNNTLPKRMAISMVTDAAREIGSWSKEARSCVPIRLVREA